MKIVEVPVSSTEDAIFVDIGTSFIVCVFNISYYHQTDSFARIEQIENPNTPLYDVSLSNVTLLLTSFRVYGFHNSCRTQTVPLYPGVSADDANTTSTDSVTFGR